MRESPTLRRRCQPRPARPPIWGSSQIRTTVVPEPRPRPKPRCFDSRVIPPPKCSQIEILIPSFRFQVNSLHHSSRRGLSLRAFRRPRAPSPWRTLWRHWRPSDVPRCHEAVDDPGAFGPVLRPRTPPSLSLSLKAVDYPNPSTVREKQAPCWRPEAALYETFNSHPE